ncbi:MAG: UDP-glucose--hexose-1-phosphate uridylyltransferase [Anaerolineae bacterium]|nr:UDP-glucose--hexose-1-phosphate uridylyltransferase [Anaerolineae bacterium]
MFNPIDHPHRRLNPLTGEYVLVSPHRMKRPWQGKQEAPPPDNRPSYDATCYLCPGNTRAGGIQNPAYTSTYVFTNDFSALLLDTPASPAAEHPLFTSESARGTCRVICFSPRHDLTLPEMALADIRSVIEVWVEQTVDLGKTYRWVQVFENKGEIMGCSNPHPHGQVWGTDWLPNEVTQEDRQQREYYAQHGTPLLMDYLRLESERQERIVVENADWVAVVPYWAMWPFEILLLPRRHVLRLPDLSAQEREGLADILKRLLTRYDNLFQTPFPYSMGWHAAPNDDADNNHWQLHAHFYPPLLRSAAVKKFMVGFEMLAESQRDLTAEQAAGRLREQSEIHYKHQHNP